MAPSYLIAGCGYIGSALGDYLHRQGHAVTGLTRSPDSARLLSESHGWPVRAADLTDPGALGAIGDSFDAVVHCASSGRGGAEAYRAVFLDGLKHLSTAFPGIPIVFTSSTSVYGQTDGSLVHENSPTEPDRETGLILLAAEQFVMRLGGTALRLAGLYGPGRSVYLTKLLDGTARIETGAVNRLLNQIHRDDAVSAIATVLASPRETVSGQVFNVVDDTPLTQRECYEGLARHFGLPVPAEAPPNLERKRAWTHKRVDNARLKSLGWSPRYPGYLEAVEHDPGLIDSCRPRA